MTNPLMLPILFGTVAMATSIILLFSTKPPVVLYTSNSRQKISITQVIVISAFMAVLLGVLSAIFLNTQMIDTSISF